MLATSLKASFHVNAGHLTLPVVSIGCQVVRLWNLAKGESTMTLYGHEHVVNAVAFSSGPADVGIAECLLKVSGSRLSPDGC